MTLIFYFKSGQVDVTEVCSADSLTLLPTGPVEAMPGIDTLQESSIRTRNIALMVVDT